MTIPEKKIYPRTGDRETINPNLVCQSCSMPIKEEGHIGTNLDGSKNQDYCVFGYKDGAFLQDVSVVNYRPLIIGLGLEESFGDISYSIL